MLVVAVIGKARETFSGRLSWLLVRFLLHVKYTHYRKPALNIFNGNNVLFVVWQPNYTIVLKQRMDIH